MGSLRRHRPGHLGRTHPALVFLVVLFFITRYVLKTLHYFFDQVSEGKVTVTGLDAEVAPITFKLVKILILVFVAMVAYPYIPGSSSPAFKGISIFLGVLFSLGSSSAIANLIAGVILTYMRSFRVGDVIKVGNATGVVLERRLHVTRLKTFKNEDITIPNGIILTSHVTNLSQEVKKGEGLILYTSVTIGYNAPWKTVHQLLIEAASRTAHILKSPPPFVLQTALNDFYVTYELNAYTDAPERIPWVYGDSTRTSRTPSMTLGSKSCHPITPRCGTATRPPSRLTTCRRIMRRQPYGL